MQSEISRELSERAYAPGKKLGWYGKPPFFFFFFCLFSFFQAFLRLNVMLEAAVAMH